MKKTAVIEQEFDSIQNQITTVHSENVRQIHAALKEFEELNTAAGGFYSEEISPKIAALIEEIREIRSLADLMEAAYSAHEYIIRSFRTAVENYDDC